LKKGETCPAGYGNGKMVMRIFGGDQINRDDMTTPRGEEKLSASRKKSHMDKRGGGGGGKVRTPPAH